VPRIFALSRPDAEKPLAIVQTFTPKRTFSAADEIEKLDRLKKAGTISDGEFTRLRARLGS